MKYSISYVMFLFFILISPGFAQKSIHNLLPVPSEVKIQSGRCRIDSTFSVRVEGNPDIRINKAVSRMIKRLAGRSGLFLSQVFFDKTEEVKNPLMVITVKRPGKVVLGEDESYTLQINRHLIRLTVEDDIGALRGLETFLQLLDADEQGYFVPNVFIKDKPRFLWRGLMIDACRHFMPIKVIKRNLDGMAAVKMNVFHWHLSDDQGFRVEDKTFPKLHKLGSDGFYYTQEQIKEVIQYAADRGIRVIPEFDLPGHATSWFIGYPQYASAPGPYTLQRAFGIFDPTFNPTIEDTYIFLDAFFKEMCQLFPDEYMHIGGDENNGNQWKKNLQIRNFMKANSIKNNCELQNYFNSRLLKILTKYHKKMVGWDEILHSGMPKSIVIQSWRGKKAILQAVKKGYRTILSNGYYLDLIQSTDYHYLNDPVPKDIQLTEEQKKLILGGEATMWSEMVDPETIDSRIWPRAAAIAERLWSPALIRDVDDMYRRLTIISFHLEELGLTHLKNYPYLLRRLTNNAPTEPLKTLVDIIEPVKGYRRAELRSHYTYTQMTRVVDAARPDAKRAREFLKLVNEYLKQNTDKTQLAERIRFWLNIWKNNHPKLLPIINSSPILWEIKSLSKDLSKCALVGLEAMQIIENGQTVSKGWASKSWVVLQKAKTPRGQTELMIIPALEKLVDAADPEFSRREGDNTLSEKEKTEGWKLLFDGKTSKGWRAYNGYAFPETWEIRNGMIHYLGSKKVAEGDNIITLRRYKNFELSLEWKIAKGADSGILYLVQERKGQPIYNNSLQMQIVDSENNSDIQKRQDEKRVAGSLWDLIPAFPQNAKQVGEWNKVVITINKNGQILHNQNGLNVVEYYPWYDEWKVMISQSHYNNNSFFKNPAKKGFIGLEGNQGEVWFKNIKIRELK